MNEAPKLLPCPFCGTTKGLYPGYRGLGAGKPYQIDCCGCGIDFTPREGMDVIAAWNRRSTPLAAGSGEATPIEGLKLVERDDDALICGPHWQFGSIALARRPALMSNENWRPIANRIIAALSPCRIGEETEEAKVWRLPSVERILEEMLAVATSGEDDEEPEWMADQRATVDIWQAGLRASLSRKTTGEAADGTRMPAEPTADHIRALFMMNSALPRTTDEAKAVYQALLNISAASPPLPDTEEMAP